MADSNSTKLNKDDTSIDYSNFVTQTTYELWRIKAMLSGARSVIYDHEGHGLFQNHPDIIDSAYLLDDVIERIKNIVSDISDTEYKYQKISN